MAVVHVDLQEGFETEPVAVSVNGQDTYRKPAVRTRTQIGLADSFELTLPPGDATLAVTARGTTARFGHVLAAVDRRIEALQAPARMAV